MPTRTGPSAEPRRCRLDEPGYLTLLRDRATDTTFTDTTGNTAEIAITFPNAATVTIWTAQTYHPSPAAKAGIFRLPRDQDHSPLQGATVFTRRGDYQSHGWLSKYSAIHQN